MDKNKLSRIKKLEQGKDDSNRQWISYWCDQIPDDIDPDNSHTLVFGWKGEEMTRVTVVYE